MRIELKILLASMSLFGLAGGIFGPIYAIFVEEIGGDLLTAGIAYSLFAISTGVLILFLGRLEDRVKHQERFFVLGNLVACIGYLGYLFVSAIIHLFIVQIILGVSTAIATPVFYAVYSKAINRKKPAFQWGAIDAIWNIVAGVAAIIGGYLANLYGFRFIFIIMFIISIFGLIASLPLLKKK